MSLAAKIALSGLLSAAISFCLLYVYRETEERMLANILAIMWLVSLAAMIIGAFMAIWS